MGTADGIPVGGIVGVMDGLKEILGAGEVDGYKLGRNETVGLKDGANVVLGPADGVWDGRPVGGEVGTKLGCGEKVGPFVNEGLSEGISDGGRVSVALTLIVGVNDGSIESSSRSPLPCRDLLLHAVHENEDSFSSVIVM